MFSFYLTAAGEELSLSEKLLLGGQVSLLGMGTVFAVLAILWGLVELMHLLLHGIQPGKKKKEEPAPVAAPAPVVPAAPKNDELEIVAAITAAIAAASGASPSSFRVVSFKRANDRFSSVK